MWWVPGGTTTATRAGATIWVAAGWPSTVADQPGSKDALRTATPRRCRWTTAVAAPLARSAVSVRTAPGGPESLATGGSVGLATEGSVGLVTRGSVGLVTRGSVGLVTRGSVGLVTRGSVGLVTKGSVGLVAGAPL